jgi:hypothetical protein
MNDQAPDHSKEFYRRQFQITLEQNEKLKQILLLTDPAFSDVEVNDLSLQQWAEFVRWHEQKYGVTP